LVGSYETAELVRRFAKLTSHPRNRCFVGTKLHGRLAGRDPSALKTSIEKLTWFRNIDAHQLDLSMLPNGAAPVLGPGRPPLHQRGLERRGDRLTGTNRTRPDLDQALAAVPAGDTLVVPKLDRLARSVPDARDIGDSLATRGVKLSLGGCACAPAKAGCGPGQGQTEGEEAQADVRQQGELCRLHASGEYTIADLADLFTVSRPTVYRVLEGVDHRLVGPGRYATNSGQCASRCSAASVSASISSSCAGR
jgi:hypothetical protein